MRDNVLRQSGASRALACFCVCAALLPALTACGDNAPLAIPTDPSLEREIGTSSLHVTGEQAGMGSSAQQAAIEAWSAGYGRYQPDATIAYDPQGSGAGVTAFLQGAVAWAGTDIPLTSAQRDASRSVCRGRKAVDLPVFVSPVAFVYNLPGLNTAHVSLSPDLIAQVFSGRIAWWDDARIRAANPSLAARLPHERVTPVWRSDKSGTSQIVGEYLHAAAPRAWPYAVGKAWPVSVGQGAKGVAGVSSTVSQAPGTIGYVDLAQAGSFGVIAVLQEDKPVPPSVPASAAAVRRAVARRGRSSSPVPDLALSLDYSDTSPSVYPVTQVSYLVACPAYGNAATQRFVGSWLVYVSSSQAQELSAQVAGSVPLPQGLAGRIGGVGRRLLEEGR